MSDFKKNKRNKIRRIPERASYSKATIYPIIDAAPICHLGFVDDGQPFVIPTIHARVNDKLFVHGAKSSRTLKQSPSGIPMCVTVTLVDGFSCYSLSVSSQHELSFYDRNSGKGVW